MIYLILLLSVNANVLDGKDVGKYSPEERRNIAIELVRKHEYDIALSLAPDQNLAGCIKILKGDTREGIEDIKESAAKGNIFSCDLYVLYKLEVEQKELTYYIRNELKIYGDSTVSFESPYLKYLALDPESLYAQNLSSDSLVRPYIIFKSGMVNSEKYPEKAKPYFEKLIESYPGSVPAIVARNILRAIERKIEKSKKRR